MDNSFNPLSLLEVTIGINENDCIVIDDEDDYNNDNDEEDVYDVDNEPSDHLLTEVTVVEEMAEDEPFIVEDEPPTELDMETEVDDTPSQATNLWVKNHINNLNIVSLAESGFRKKKYINLYEVLQEKLHCTVCLCHVGMDTRNYSLSLGHPVLKVLACIPCANFYKSKQFLLDENGRETRCRWCAKSSEDKDFTALKSCSKCPFSFCEMCLHINTCNYYEPWTCIVCNMRELWPKRATLWAAQSLMSMIQSSGSSTCLGKDIALCCKGRRIKRRKKLLDTFNLLQKDSSPHDLEEWMTPHLLEGFTDIGADMPDEKQIKNKPKAKPRPKSVKAKEKLLKLSSEPSLLKPKVHNLENLTGQLNNYPANNMNWLITKLNGYRNDFNQFKIELDEIEKSLSSANSNDYELKVNSLSTLFSIEMDRLRNCQTNLLDEWKQRKARIDFVNHNSTNLQTNNSTNLQTNNSTDLQTNNSTNLQTNNSTNLQTNNSTNLQTNNSTNLQTNSSTNLPTNKTKGTNNHVSTKRSLKKTPFKSKNHTEPDSNEKICENYGIKDCFVKLENIELKL